MFEPTASQTVGPYLRIGTCWLTISHLVPADCPGEHISITGRLTDGDGQPVNDALVEIWQADSHGRYAHPDDTQPVPLTPGFGGFGRVPTDDNGEFRFHTIKPGPVPDPQGGRQAPHILVAVFMRGLLRHVVSRIYFPDEPLNADDRVLGSVPPERRKTLIARRASADELEWNIVLQGDDETVFFDC